MSVQVKLPSTFRKYTDGNRIVEVDPGTVKVIIDKILSIYPALKEKLIEREDKVKDSINIFLNEEKLDIPDDLEKKVKDMDRILILLAISGG